MSSYELDYDKETDNKHRWITDVDGVAFKLYIPRAALPDPPPPRIRVWVEKDSRRATNANTKAVVELKEKHSNTIRYAPVGDPKEWQIGEPYIPVTVLDRPWPERLHIAVSWD